MGCVDSSGTGGGRERQSEAQEGGRDKLRAKEGSIDQWKFIIEN